jgi:PAS domain S-box-containing protein
MKKTGHHSTHSHLTKRSRSGNAITSLESRENVFPNPLSIQEQQALFASLDLILLVIDVDGCIQHIHPTHLAHQLFASDTLLGKEVGQIFTFSHLSGIQPLLHRIFSAQNIEHVDYRQRINGEDHWFSAAITRLSDNQALWSARDITEFRTVIRQKEQSERNLKESEGWFRMLYERAPVPYQSLDENGCIIEVNEAWLQMFGYTREEVIGKNCGEVMTPEFARIFPSRFGRFKDIGEIHSIEFEMMRKNGDIFSVAVDGRIGKYGDGSFKQTHCVLYDITERKKSEQTALDHAKRQSALARLSLLALSDIDINSLLSEASVTIATVLNAEYSGVMEVIAQRQVMLARAGYGFRSEDIGNLEVAIYPGSISSKALSTMQPVLVEDAEQEPLMKDTNLHKSMGINSCIIAVIPCDLQSWGLISVMSARTFAFGSEDVHFIQSISAMLSAALERRQHLELIKKSEETLRQSEEKFHAVFDQAGIGMAIVNEDGVIQEANKALQSFLGYNDEEFRSIHFADVIHPEDLQKCDQYPMQNQPSDDYSVQTCIRRYIHHSGEILWGKHTASIIRDKEGKFRYSINMIEDITEQMDMEDRLRVQEEDYRILFESVPIIITYVNTEGRIIRGNQAASRIMGLPLDQIEGKLISELFPEYAAVYLQDNEEVMKSRKPKLAMIRPFVTPGGKRGWWQTSKVPYLNKNGDVRGIIALSEDITERRELEQQLLQSQKMEGLGRLAGGVAHDFNNLLTVILGFGELLEENLEGNAQLEGYANNIVRSAERAGSLTHQLLAFAHQQSIESKIVYLNDLITDVGKMLQRLIGEDIELVLEKEPELWQTLIDPGQFEQIMLNLAVNSRDAMSMGGVLRISTGNIHLSEEESHHLLEAEPGDYVYAVVEDNGEGIAPDILPHIFEPFFTTKPAGKGTGLGLATCYGIVKQNKGFIRVHSDVGKGTKFEIYFPKAQAAAEEIEKTNLDYKTTGSETILLVEDEEMVRDMAQHTLEHLGYRVLCASNGVEALKIYKESSDRIDLLLTDVVMPQMGGKELYENIFAIDSTLPVLFASGYTDNVHLFEEVTSRGAAFLHKPFSPASLARKVREILS